MVWNAIHYMLERKFFLGGIILINLKNAKSMRGLFEQMKKVLIQSLKLPIGQKRETLQNADEEKFTDVLVKFF